GQELDLLPQPEDAVLPDDVPVQLLAPDRPRGRHEPLLLDPDGDVLLEVQAAAAGRLRQGGGGWPPRRGDPAGVRPLEDRDGLPDPRRPLVPDSVRRPEPRARRDPRVPRAARDLLARALRLVEVRDRQPGPLADAGRRARGPLARRLGGEGLPQLG